MKKKPEPLATRPADEAAEWLKHIAEKGDKGAFIRLFGYFAPRIKNYLIRQGLNAPLADDLTQDVMFQIWRRAAQFDAKRARASTWIYTIARNRMIDERRRDKGTSLVRALGPEEEPGYEPQQDVEAASDATQLQKAIKLLPPEQRKLIEQSYFEDQSQRDIAARTKIPLGTIKSRMRLALSKLKDTLKGEI